MLKITILVGNPKANSRTLQIASRLAAEVVGETNADVQIIDLAEHQDELFVWPSDHMASLSARVAESDLIFVASPTYKASYTGLLKAFLDRYPANALQGAVAVPVMTGADATHAMGADTHLVPLLTELGAIVLGGALYFMTHQMNQIDTMVTARAQELLARLTLLNSLAEGLRANRQPAPSILR